MACPSPVLSAEQRSWHYWFDDGLPSLLTGIACLLLAASLLDVPVILGLIWWVFAELGELFHFLLSIVGLTYAASGLIRIILYLHRNRRAATPQS